MRRILFAATISRERAEACPAKGEVVQDRTFQRWCNKANVSPHQLRYSFATYWYEQSKDIERVRFLLGHSNVAITSRYLRIGRNRMIEQTRQMFSMG